MAELVDGPRPASSPSIPTWDDRLHVPLRRQPTAADLVRLQRAARSGDDEDLMPADRACLRQRRLIAERAAASGIPEWRETLVGVVTALDNVQDIVATAAWLGGPLLRSMGRLGPWLHGEVQATATALGTLERGIGGPLPGGRAKHEHMNQRRADARRRTGVIGGLQRGMEWFGRSQGHLLEAAQASDTLFGVGLTLGAMMGALEETYWRTGKAAYYIAMSSVNVVIAELAGLSAAGQAAAREAAGKYAAAGREVPPAPPIEWSQEFYRTLRSPSELRRAWSRAAHLVGLAGPDIDLQTGDWSLAALSSAGVSLAVGPQVHAIAEVLDDAEIRDLLMPAPRVRDWGTRALLESFGAPIDARGVAGSDWATPEQTLDEYTARSLGAWMRAPKDWLPADPSSPRAQLIHQLVEVQMPATAALLSGEASALRDLVTPEDQLLFRVVELHSS